MILYQNQIQIHLYIEQLYKFMVQSDLLGLIFVYGYVAILLLVSEKLLSK